MNKKQWLVLGFLFFFYGAIASRSQEAMYEFPTSTWVYVMVMAAVACWICGWLENGEEDREYIVIEKKKEEKDEAK